MQIENSDSARIIDFQTCVVFDRETGKIAHIHDSITYAGSEIPGREYFEARAIELAKQLAADREGVSLDRLEILHVKPEELEDVLAPYVDVKTRTLIQQKDLLPPRYKAGTYK